MKKLTTVLFFIISAAAYAQSDLCSICESLAQSKESKKEYDLKCVQRDSTHLGEFKYEIRKAYKCKDKITLSQYSDKDSIPFYSIEIMEGRDTIYLLTDKSAEFVKGRTGMVKYINHTFIYPKDAAKRNIQGKVITTFLVSKTGKVYRAKVFKEVNPSLDKEAIRVIEGMPDWIPAQYKDKPVTSRITLPINFTLSE